MIGSNRAGFKDTDSVFGFHFEPVDSWLEGNQTLAPRGGVRHIV